jgi:hypothetical protein
MGGVGTHYLIFKKNYFCSEKVTVPSLRYSVQYFTKFTLFSKGICIEYRSSDS